MNPMTDTLSRWRWVIAVAVLVVVAVVVGIMLWPRPRPAAVITLSAVKSALLRTAKTPVPPVATSTLIAARLLPSFVRALILPQATGTSAAAVRYAGSKLGYEIRYAAPQPLADAYAAFMGSMGTGKWIRTGAVRADAFAYVEFSGNGLSGRAEFTPMPASSTAVLVRVLQP
jgi:hypothetical protein